MPASSEPVPVTVITGALGVGKTTAVLDLFAQRPPDERWAVLVNEFGQVGIDGPVLSSGGLQVKEVPGGCICCTAGLELRMGLVQLLRQVRPDRLLIEPSGVARPATVIDVLRSPGLAEAVDLRAVITLVDPRAFLQPTVRAREGYADQVLLADVLVGNWADRCSEAELEGFRRQGAALFPPKLVVATTEHGHLDPAWLELRAAPRERARVVGVSGDDDHGHHEASSDPQGPPELGRFPTEGADADGCGWVWPPERVFDRLDLEEALQELVHPGPALPDGALRIKGVFRTPRVVLLVHAGPESIRFEALDWRRDSRVEILVPSGSQADWDAVEGRLESCLTGSR